ncbi:MAG: alpha/beta hydrolase [Anaerolineales bacterium]|nr:alpha/beta hydrolase [Anaerolineales bacterium]
MPPSKKPPLGCSVRSAGVGVLTLLILLVLGPFLVPVGNLPQAQPLEALADPDSRFITVNAVRVHYKEQGAGPRALILLHGLGASTFTWQAVLPALAAEGRVLALDRPGFGLTSRPRPGTWAEVNPYSPEGQTALVLGFMEALAIERTVLVGHSAGGTLAAQFALAHPERVEALVLVDAAVYQGGGTPAVLAPLLNSPQAQHLGPLVGRAFIGNLPQFIRGLWADPTRITPEILAGYQKPFQAEDADLGFWQLVAASQSTTLAPQLSALTMPALVLTGAQDTTVPVDQSARLARELPNAEYAALAQCGHLPQEECPAALLAALQPFLQRLP